jgi:hypothetical protein
MTKQHIIVIGLVMAAVMAVIPGWHGAAAARKNKGTAKARAVKGPAPVPGKRVIQDFTGAYRTPEGLKTQKITYIGVARNYLEKRMDVNVPVQLHTVAVTGSLTECGLKMKNIWEARYYRLETEWVFQDISQKKSAPAGRPSARLPAPDDATLKKLITDGIASQYGSPVQEVTLLGKKGSWTLCVPTYRVTAKVVITTHDNVRNTITSHECLMVSTIARERGSWSYVTAGCVYKGNSVPDCHIGTMCRTISTESSVLPVSDAEAVVLMKGALEKEYGLRKNRIEIEKFDMTGRLPAEVFGTSVPCVFNAVFVIDENQETPAADGTRIAEKVRAVYECVVSGSLRYSLRGKKWEGFIASCCAPGAAGCGISCSTPYKGCRRLGTK